MEEVARLLKVTTNLKHWALLMVAYSTQHIFKRSKKKAGITTFFVHGSTIIINALTERKGVKTGLITTLAPKGLHPLACPG